MLPSAVLLSHGAVPLNQVALASGKDRVATEFTADGVYLPKDGNEAVYKQEVQPLVHSVHQGFNATILAYGEAGSSRQQLSSV